MLAGLNPLKPNPPMLDKAKRIVVEGPIGAGKTSLAKRLADRLDARAVLEQPERNAFLARFYEDMDRWGLATQLGFLFQRIDLLDEHADATEGAVVSDFLLEKDPLFAELNLRAEELDVYRRIFEALRPAQPPKPDLVVYLQARPETLVDRVRKRGMEAEKRVSEAYLARVSDCYARFFYDYDDAPLFIVDAEVLNPVDHDDDFELLIERLAAMRGYREFFGYAA